LRRLALAFFATLLLPVAAADGFDSPCEVGGFSTYYLNTEALALERDGRFAVCDSQAGRGPAFLRADGSVVKTGKARAGRLQDVRFSGYGPWMAVTFRARGRSLLVVVDLKHRVARVVEAGRTIGNFRVLSNGSVLYEVVSGGDAADRGVYFDSIRDGSERLATPDNWAGGLAVAVPSSGKAVVFWSDRAGDPHMRRVVSARKHESGYSPAATRSSPCLREGWIVEYAKGTARFVRKLKPGHKLGGNNQYYACDTRYGKLIPFPRTSTALDYDAAGNYLYVYDAIDGPGLPLRVVYNLRTGVRRVAIAPKDGETVEAEQVTGRGTLIFGNEIAGKGGGFKPLRVDVTAVTFSGRRINLFSDPKPAKLDAEEVAYADGRVYWRVGRKAFSAPAP
jgi:hypothetical protein